MPLVRRASSSLRTCVNSSAWEFQHDSSTRWRKLTFTAQIPEVSPATYCWPQASESFPLLTRRTRERRSEEHTSELQSHLNLVCRLLLEKKKTGHNTPYTPCT